MTMSAVLLIVLAAQDFKLSCELKELPGDAKKPPLLVAEGTTDLPDGAILKVYLYLGPVQPGEERARGLVQAKDGKFTKDFQIFGPRERVLAGIYWIRVQFDPDLQPPKLQNLPPRHVDAKLEVGDALAREKEHAAVRKQLADEVRAMQAIADEIDARFTEAKGKPDPKAWGALLEGWKRRLYAIEHRAMAVAEYQHLGLLHIADSGLENLREIVLGLAAAAGKGEAAPLKEGRIVLDRAAQNLLGELTTALPPRQLREMAEEARKIVADAPGLPADGLLRARRRFVALTFSLDRNLGEKQHDLLGAMADAGKRMFDALEEKRTDAARPLQAELLKLSDTLLEGLQDPK